MMKNRYHISGKTHAYTRKKTISVRIIILITAAVILTGVISGIYLKFFRSEDLNIQIDFPGSKTQSLTFEKQKSTQEMRNMFLSRLTDNGGILEYFQIAGKAGNPPAKMSETMIFNDQLELLSFYAEQRNEKEFNKLNAWIRDKFQTDEGFFVKYILSINQQKPERNKDTAGSHDISTASQINYCRILIEGYARFRKSLYLNSAKELAGLVYPLCEKKHILPAELSIALPGNTPTPDYSATPSPKSTITPIIDALKIKYINVVDLSSIDLYALKILASIDNKWDAVYSNCVDTIMKAVISDPVPLFQSGYDIEKNSYVPYLYKNPEFIFEDQMKIALHLAEVSELNESTFSYLKQQLFNTKNFFQRYSILTGIASTEDESITGYAMMARVARLRQDKESYELCIQRITWNTATSSSSTIYQLPFRTMANGDIRAYSTDVIRTLKALY